MTANAHSNSSPTGGRHRRRPADDGPVGARRAGEDRAAKPEGWDRVQAVVDAVPEAVFVAVGGRLALTNAAADRLFAEEPVADRSDLMTRFEPVAVEPPDAPPASDRVEPSDDAVIVRQRNRPNRWFALRTVTLDPAGEPPVERSPSDPSATSSRPADDDASDPVDGGGGEHEDAADAPVAFVLRDVTDTPDLRPLREAFLGLVSHELRTPITTIYAGSTVLARSPRLSMPATRTLAHDVSAEAARLYDVVEDLLALGRIERAVLDPLDEPVDVGQVIAATIRVAAGRHPLLRIRRSGRTGAIIARGDTTYLDQALRNLVLGIARRPGGVADAAIDLEVAIDRDRGELTVTIRDDGPPLSRAELESLFEIVELGAPANPLGGLGLYIARQLVEAMGGRVWAAAGSGERGLEVGIGLRLA